MIYQYYSSALLGIAPDFSRDSVDSWTIEESRRSEGDGRKALYRPLTCARPVLARGLHTYKHSPRYEDIEAATYVQIQK
jgi:hypothetical protein